MSLIDGGDLDISRNNQWLTDGNLVYRLRFGVNHDCIRVDMVDGSHDNRISQTNEAEALQALLTRFGADSLRDLHDKVINHAPSKHPSVKFLELGRTRPLHVRFKRRIQDEDYIEPGMEGYLTDVEMYYDENKPIHYTLHFDMTDFMESNKRFLKQVYYPNSHTGYSGPEMLYTAEEAGMYTNKLTVYYGDTELMTAEQHEAELAELYLEVVDG